MKKQFLLQFGIIVIAVAATYSLMSFNPKQDRKITITLPEQEWNIVLQGLSELPFKTSQATINSIIQQASNQLTSPKQVQEIDSTTKKKRP